MPLNISVLQSFVSGLEDNYIRQRILENDVVTLEDALKCADILKRAKVDAENMNCLKHSNQQ